MLGKFFYSCPLEPKMILIRLWIGTGKKGARSSWVSFSLEGKRQSIPVLCIGDLWSRRSSGLHSPIHYFMPVLPASESSWIVPLHTLDRSVPVSHLPGWYEVSHLQPQDRKLFYLWSSFCHKFCFLAKIRVSHSEPVVNLLYT